jgi:hypothetical protein
VVAFDDNGKAVAKQEVHTAGKPYQIVLDPGKQLEPMAKIYPCNRICG